MDLNRLSSALLTAARADVPSDRVPYAFEKRVMARLPGRPSLDHLALWSRGLWRAAFACLAVMMLFGAWSAVAPTPKAAPPDLSQQFENTVLAVADQDQTILQ